MEVRSLSADKSDGLQGIIEVPGDKSISHRALILASQAIGETKIENLLESKDVLNTKSCLQQLGCEINKKDGKYIVSGLSLGGLNEPDNFLDLGNSGTGVRLMMGLLAGYGFKSFFTGDGSLRKRPMNRVINPLSEMGAEFYSRGDGRLPILLKGNDKLINVDYHLPVPSAQVKSAILLAAMKTSGVTRAFEKDATRDHTEIMMKNLGLNIESFEDSGRRVIEIEGNNEFDSKDFYVPGDPSSAAFPVVAALITPNSNVRINNVMINPLRAGLFDVLKEMGGDITFDNVREISGEKVADIIVKSSELRGIRVPAEKAPSMIDEYPVLSVAAACAEGETVMEGLKELKVKESNRLEAIKTGLAKCGVEAEEKSDTLKIIPQDKGDKIIGGCDIETQGDHRIAMSFLVAGLVSSKKITVDRAEMIETSFTDFKGLMSQIGANIS